MPFDFTALVFPALIFLILSLKYLVKRLYRHYSAKREAERVENLNRILLSNPLLQSFSEHPDLPPRTRDRLRRAPPPNYEVALQQHYAMPVFYIHIQDETPPPTYDDYLKMTQDLPPAYRPV